MKFSCPKCKAKLTLQAERIPVAGAWAKCPRCAERFFIPAPDKTLDLAPTSRVKAPSFASGGKNTDRQELLSRLKQKKGTDVPPIDLNEITVYPDYVQYPMLRRVVIGVSLLLPLVVVAVGFFTATPVIPPVQAPPAPSQNIELSKQQDSAEDIKSEILHLRQRLMFSGQFKFYIGFSGVETKIFNFFMNRLIPNVCTSISHLEMSSKTPQNGFTAVGSCIDKGAPPKVEMEVEWGTRTITVSFPKVSANIYKFDIFK